MINAVCAERPRWLAGWIQASKISVKVSPGGGENCWYWYTHRAEQHDHGQDADRGPVDGMSASVLLDRAKALQGGIVGRC